jgi:myo-inositol catabolism protein IolC
MARGWDRPLYVQPFDHRGADDSKVREWLSVAAKMPGFVGFAVGRTAFWDPLVAWHAGKATPEEAAARIASRYKEFVDLFEER